MRTNSSVVQGYTSAGFFLEVEHQRLFQLGRTVPWTSSRGPNGWAGPERWESVCDIPQKGRCSRCSDHSFTVIYVAWQLPGLTNAEFLLLVVKQKGCWVFQGSFIPKPEFIGHLLGGDSLILSHTQFFSGDLGGLIPIICPDIMLKKALKVEVND